jgi:hypothetical protein
MLTIARFSCFFATMNAPDIGLTTTAFFIVTLHCGMKRIPLLLTLLLTLAACTQPTPKLEAQLDPDFIHESEAALDQLAELSRNSNSGELAQYLAGLGQGFKNHDAASTTISPMLADGCPTRFDAPDRSTWHQINGGFYYIDSLGRPLRAYRYIPAISDAPRDSTCQGTVGKLAAPTGYDGGHLVGSQLGGYGRRANMAPQLANFNRGNWLQVENQVAKCGGLSNNAVLYLARLAYPSSSTNTPSQYIVEITIGGEKIARTFNNATSGGPNGTTYRTEVVNWLKAKGCN